MARAERSSFGRIVLAGLATAALTAVAASQTWLHARVEGIGRGRGVDVSGSDGAPLALALALVALAAWGVILVSQLRARRVAAVIALVATLGVLVVVAALWPDVRDVAERVAANRGVDDVTSVSRRPWYWITGLAALGQAAVLVVALRAAPTWPTMSSRYDAPGAATEGTSTVAADDAGPRPDLELWKAFDEGHDPTAGPNP